jgi:hypothetical protein
MLGGVDLDVAVPADGFASVECEFEVSFVGGSGGVLRRSLADCSTFGFEQVEPVRGFRWSRSDRHFPGWFWAATTGGHVGYESWLERDRLILLDFDREISGICSQPFWLHWHDGVRWRRHAPDYFVRRTDGSAMVVDVRADERVEAGDAAVFAITDHACRSVGWGFARVGTPGQVLMANVRWLSRYRHPRCRNPGVAERLLQMSGSPRGLFEMAERAGERLAVLPTLYHLLWSGELSAADLQERLLYPDTAVARLEAAGGR